MKDKIHQIWVFVYLAVKWQLLERLQLNVISSSFAINFGDMEAHFGYNRRAETDIGSELQ
jgi:hypothetical protein